MDKNLKLIDELFRRQHGFLIDQTENKQHFTDEEFHKYYGKIMVMNSLKSELIKNLQENA